MAFYPKMWVITVVEVNMGKDYRNSEGFRRRFVLFMLMLAAMLPARAIAENTRSENDREENTNLGLDIPKFDISTVLKSTTSADSIVVHPPISSESVDEHAGSEIPDDIQALIKLAISQAKSGNHEEARKYLRAATSRNPKNVEYFGRCARRYADDNANEKIKYYSAAIEFDKNPIYFHKLANLYLEKENYVDAESAIKNALDIEPNNEKYRETQGKIQQAKLRRIHQLQVDANNYYYVHEYSLAIECYIKILSYNYRDADMLHGLAECRFELGNYEEALKDLKEAIKLDPDYKVFLKRCGAKLTELQHYEDALSYFMVVHELEPNAIEPLLWCGNAKFSLGQYEDAISYYSKALEKPINDQDLHAALFNNRGLCYMNLGQYEMARVDFVVSRRIMPDNQGTLSHLQLLYQKINQESQEKQENQKKFIRDLIQYIIQYIMRHLNHLKIDIVLPLLVGIFTLIKLTTLEEKDRQEENAEQAQRAKEIEERRTRVAKDREVLSQEIKSADHRMEVHREELRAEEKRNLDDHVSKIKSLFKQIRSAQISIEAAEEKRREKNNYRLMIKGEIKPEIEIIFSDKEIFPVAIDDFSQELSSAIVKNGDEKSDLSVSFWQESKEIAVAGYALNETCYKVMQAVIPGVLKQYQEKFRQQHEDKIKGLFEKFSSVSVNLRAEEKGHELIIEPESKAEEKSGSEIQFKINDEETFPIARSEFFEQMSTSIARNRDKKSGLSVFVARDRMKIIVTGYALNDAHHQVMQKAVSGVMSQYREIFKREHEDKIRKLFERFKSVLVNLDSEEETYVLKMELIAEEGLGSQIQILFDSGDFFSVTRKDFFNEMSTAITESSHESGLSISFAKKKMEVTIRGYELNAAHRQVIEQAVLNVIKQYRKKFKQAHENKVKKLFEKFKPVSVSFCDEEKGYVLKINSESKAEEKLDSKIQIASSGGEVLPVAREEFFEQMSTAILENGGRESGLSVSFSPDKVEINIEGYVLCEASYGLMRKALSSLEQRQITLRQEHESRIQKLFEKTKPISVTLYGEEIGYVLKIESTTGKEADSTVQITSSDGEVFPVEREEFFGQMSTATTIVESTFSVIKKKMGITVENYALTETYFQIIQRTMKELIKQCQEEFKKKRDIKLSEQKVESDKLVEDITRLHKEFQGKYEALDRILLDVKSKLETHCKFLEEEKQEQKSFWNKKGDIENRLSGISSFIKAKADIVKRNEPIGDFNVASKQQYEQWISDVSLHERTLNSIKAMLFGLVESAQKELMLKKAGEAKNAKNKAEQEAAEQANRDADDAIKKKKQAEQEVFLAKVPNKHILKAEIKTAQPTNKQHYLYDFPNNIYNMPYDDRVELAVQKAMSIAKLRVREDKQDPWYLLTKKYALQCEIIYCADVMRTLSGKDTEMQKLWISIRNAGKHAPDMTSDNTVIALAESLLRILCWQFGVTSKRPMLEELAQPVAITKDQKDDIADLVGILKSQWDFTYDDKQECNGYLQQVRAYFDKAEDDLASIMKADLSDEDYILWVCQQVIPVFNAIAKPVLAENNSTSKFEKYQDEYERSDILALKRLLLLCGELYNEQREARFTQAGNDLVGFLDVSKKVYQSIGHEEPETIGDSDVFLACEEAQRINPTLCKPTEVNLSFPDVNKNKVRNGSSKDEKGNDSKVADKRPLLTANRYAQQFVPPVLSLNPALSVSSRAALLPMSASSSTSVPRPALLPTDASSSASISVLRR